MERRVRLWRWRRNPLRRRCDVAEAWVGLAAGVLMVVGAPAAGAAALTGSAEAMLREAREARRTTAVVTDVHDTVTVSGVGPLGTVRWTSADGTPRTGMTRLPPGVTAGARVTVWLDGDGAPRGAPPSPAAAWAAGALLGTGVAGGVCLLALGARGGARSRLDARRSARWEREWAEIAPRWSRRAL
ncbi:Rv1733c family protein [Streptomyces sp. URMC 129]|uniref:Rv1733c family protein n=1 Tax=Streptomyces sp. URMC 129 TaxID=3423407 RepID=UPI003F1AA136